MSVPAPLTESPQVLLERIIYQIEKVIVGKREVIEQLLIALLSGGHVLLEDVPGVGKTMLVRALSRAVDGQFKRIQCTPDLLPSDITGSAVYNPRTTQFEFRSGPLMASIVLADELNRAAPRTQSALLEAMEEKRITVDGETYSLPEPFFLLATQNPLEFEGTFPLPEAQLDRFAMRLRLGYPEPEEEIRMLDNMEQSISPLQQVRKAVLTSELLQLKREAGAVFVDESMKQYIVGLIRSTRSHTSILLGASPRASAALMRAAQACAYMQGRGYVIPDDVKKLAVPVLAHRLLPSEASRIAGRSMESVVEELTAAVRVPSKRAAGQ